MKRFRYTVAVVIGCVMGAFVAVAAPDVDPWQAVTNNQVFMRPVRFEQEARFANVDAGSIATNTLTATTSQVTSTLKVAVLDAGVGLFNGQVQMIGPLRADTITATFATIDAGQILDNGVLQVLGSSVLQAVTATTVQGTGQIGTTAGIDAGYILSNGVTRSLGPINAVASVQLNGSTFASATAVSVTACSGGTAASITWANGTAAFVFDVGTSCASESTAVITLPAAANGWICACSSTTADRILLQKVIPPANATTVTMQNIVISTGANGDFTDGADVGCQCHGG